jgi:hypothetical protein
MGRAGPGAGYVVLWRGHGGRGGKTNRNFQDATRKLLENGALGRVPTVSRDASRIDARVYESISMTV